MKEMIVAITAYLDKVRKDCRNVDEEFTNDLKALQKSCHKLMSSLTPSVISTCLVCRQKVVGAKLGRCRSCNILGQRVVEGLPLKDSDVFMGSALDLRYCTHKEYLSASSMHDLYALPEDMEEGEKYVCIAIPCEPKSGGGLSSKLNFDPVDFGIFQHSMGITNQRFANILGVTMKEFLSMKGLGFISGNKEVMRMLLFLVGTFPEVLTFGERLKHLMRCDGLSTLRYLDVNTLPLFDDLQQITPTAT